MMHYHIKYKPVDHKNVQLQTGNSMGESQQNNKTNLPFQKTLQSLRGISPIFVA